METEKLLSIVNLVLMDIAEATDITNINFKPHSYCITPSHLNHNNSMYLGESQIVEMEKQYGNMCGMYHNGRGKYENHRTSDCTTRCNMSYKEHTSDRVMFLKLKRNCTNDKISPLLKKIAPMIEKEGVDGIALL